MLTTTDLSFRFRYFFKILKRYVSLIFLRNRRIDIIILDNIDHFKSQVPLNSLSFKIHLKNCFRLKTFGQNIFVANNDSFVELNIPVPSEGFNNGELYLRIYGLFQTKKIIIKVNKKPLILELDSPNHIMTFQRNNLMESGMIYSPSIRRLTNPEIMKIEEPMFFCHRMLGSLNLNLKPPSLFDAKDIGEL